MVRVNGRNLAWREGMTVADLLSELTTRILMHWPGSTARPSPATNLTRPGCRTTRRSSCCTWWRAAKGHRRGRRMARVKLTEQEQYAFHYPGAAPRRREPGGGARARAGERRGPCRPPRSGRRLRDGLPQPLARPGAGGLRHRVPRGGGGRRARHLAVIPGAAEAVLDGVTGLVVECPEDPGAVARGAAQPAGGPEPPPPDGPGGPFEGPGILRQRRSRF